MSCNLVVSTPEMSWPKTGGKMDDYDYDKVRSILDESGFATHIKSPAKEIQDIKIKVG